ncbi:MAG TPA: ATP-NAD kinase [Chloroflexi bacterium]|nr:ATP-NAD kinase [Chloroflexota bacterium]
MWLLPGRAALNQDVVRVGIIANPASGKDIRRLVGHATVVDNQGKVAIIRRVLIGLRALGVERALIMPDTYHLGERAIDGLSYADQEAPALELVDMPVTGEPEDSEHAARLMAERGVRVVVVLGGDGTVRMVSKGAGNIPLLPLSTGTNNVLPTFVEGTVAGMAAAAVALHGIDAVRVSIRHKWLELLVNGASVDGALVDMATLAGRFVGARAVWNAGDLRQVMVTRADPASIGISAIAGALHPVDPEEPLGVALQLSPQARRRVLAAIGPGILAEVGVVSASRLALGEAVAVVPERPILLAMDGERAVALHEGEDAAVRLRDDGPWLLDPGLVMREVVARGLLDRSPKDDAR